MNYECKSTLAFNTYQCVGKVCNGKARGSGQVMKPLSGRSLTLIVLLILPSLFVVSIYVVSYVLIDYFVSISNVYTLQQNVQYASSINKVISAFQIIVFITMLIVYPPYPAPYSADKYFTNRGY